MADDHSASSRRRFVTLGFTALAVLPWCGCRSNRAACGDTQGLSEADKKTRETLGYVNRAPDLTKTCEKCVQYIEPEDGTKCPECKVMKGPVNPEGYCNVFAPKS